VRSEPGNFTREKNFNHRWRRAEKEKRGNVKKEDKEKRRELLREGKVYICMDLFDVFFF
jgi:hypothetical protein